MQACGRGVDSRIATGERTLEDMKTRPANGTIRNIFLAKVKAATVAAVSLIAVVGGEPAVAQAVPGVTNGDKPAGQAVSSVPVPLAASDAVPAKDRAIPAAFVPACPSGNTQDGPALSAVTWFHSQTRMDSVGNVFVIDPVQEQILFFSKEENRVYTLCTGTSGYRDGLAGEAQIGLFGNDMGWPSVLVDSKDRLIFADRRSRTVRMVSRSGDGPFEFSTLIGAGQRKPGDIKVGESVPAGDVAAFSGSVLIGCAPDGALSMLAQYPAGRFKLAGGKVTRMPYDTNIGAAYMAVDADDNIYALMGRDCYVKVEKSGKIVYLGGVSEGARKRLAPPDTPPLAPGKCGRDGPMIQATFWCPATLGLSADGKALYIGGGDEGTLRRLMPIAPDGCVTTLMQDGTWKECEYQGEKGQWRDGRSLLGMVNPRSGLCLDVGGGYFDTPYKDAWLTWLEGPKVELIRKALGFQMGGGK